MYKIIKNGKVIATLSRLDWVRRQENGVCIRTDEAASQGVIVDGTVYSIRGVAQLPGAEEVDIIQVQDQPTEEQRVEAMLQANMAPIMAAARAYAMAATEIPDASALEMAALFPTWEDVLSTGAELAAGRIISSDGQLYRVVQATVPQAHQAPGNEGMLAIYRPIDREHAGTAEDPIPWVYGMDCLAGLYYSYNGVIYRVANGGDMIPCVWAPDTPGLWQWEKIKEVS